MADSFYIKAPGVIPVTVFVCKISLLPDIVHLMLQIIAVEQADNPGGIGSDDSRLPDSTSHMDQLIIKYQLINEEF